MGIGIGIGIGILVELALFWALGWGIGLGFAAVIIFLVIAFGHMFSQEPTPRPREEEEEEKPKTLPSPVILRLEVPSGLLVRFPSMDCTARLDQADANALESPLFSQERRTNVNNLIVDSTFPYEEELGRMTAGVWRVEADVSETVYVLDLSNASAGWKKATVKPRSTDNNIFVKGGHTLYHLVLGIDREFEVDGVEYKLWQSFWH